LQPGRYQVIVLKIPDKILKATWAEIATKLK
jgi:hypothetical protein